MGKITKRDLEDDFENEVTGVLSFTSAIKYGFVSDYTGIPYYDGLDYTRITCTDNTTAFSNMLNDAILKKNLAIYFPAGHYGIKIGNLIKNLTGCNLCIYGDGIGITTIDFVKEDSSKADLFVNDTLANYIAKISNANNILFKDLTIKATTKRDLGVFKGYGGAVWGFIFDTFKKLTYENVEVSNFAYNGIYTKRTGATNTETLNDTVNLINCYMHDNSSTGAFIRYTKNFNIIGGEYCYNGVKGDFATGYAFTGSTYIDTIITKDVYIHHNYANGFDAHGCCNIRIDGCRMEDNIRRDISCHSWGLYRDKGAVIITNTTISKGLTTAGENFMRDVYEESETRGGLNLLFARGEHINIGSDDGNGNTLDSIEEVVLQNVNILSCYNGGDIVQNIYQQQINIDKTKKLTIDKCNWNLKKWTKGNIETVNSPSKLSPAYFNVEEYNFTDFIFNFPSDCFSSTSIVRGCLILIAYKENLILNMLRCNLKTYNSYIFGQTTAQDGTNPEMIAIPYFGVNSERYLKDLDIDITVTPPVDAIDKRINIGYSDVGTEYVSNKKIKIGDITFKCPDDKNTYSKMYKSFDFIGTTYTTGQQIATIVLNKTSYFFCTVKASNGVLGDDVLSFRNESTYFVSPYTIVTDGSKITVSAGSIFTDTDGISKIKFAINAKVNIANFIDIEVMLKGKYYSLGVEKIILGIY